MGRCILQMKAQRGFHPAYGSLRFAEGQLNGLLIVTGNDLCQTLAVLAFRRAFLKPFESNLLKLLGYLSLGFAAFQITLGNVPAATVCAAVGILLFFLARFSQFKRFKGWGFEAEMWDEKQLEAEKLVKSLKDVAALTAREVMLQSIKSGRWGNGKRWSDHWKHFEEIKAAQTGLLDEISAKDIKRSVDRWFLHDMVVCEFGKLQEIVEKGINSARQVIIQKHGAPILNLIEFSADNERIQEISKASTGLFDLAGQSPFINALETWWQHACAVLLTFDVQIEMPLEVKSKLETYKALESLPEMPVTAELIAAADL